MHYSPAALSLSLFSTLAISTPTKIAPRAPEAGFNLYETSYSCDAGAPITAAPQSKISSKYCFNLDATALAGTFVWPADKSYQAIFYTAPDCPGAQQQEKQRDTTTYTYTPMGTLGNRSPKISDPASLQCFGAIWNRDGGKGGSVWMSPASVVPPGGWPAIPS